MIILYFVSSRYRLLIVPAIAMTAAAGIVLFLDLASVKNVKQLVKYTCAATALSLMLCFPTSFPEERVNFESEMYRSLGYNRSQKKDYPGSFLFYEKALQSDARNTDALVGMSIVMAELNRNVEAIQYITKAIDFHPELPGLRFNLGMIYLRQGNAREAEHSFVETLKLDPSFRGTNLNLGVALEKQQRYEEAAIYFRRELSIYPGNPQANALLERTLMKIGQEHRR